MVKTYYAAQIVMIAGSLTCLADSGDPVYSRTIDLAPIQMTYPEFLGLCNAVLDLSGTAPTDGPSIHVIFSDGNSELDLSPPLSITKTVAAPSISSKATFRIWNPKEPISEVLLILGDLTRQLRVSGTSPTRVDSLAASIEKELGRHIPLVGGLPRRIVLYAAFIVALYLVLLVAFLRNPTKAGFTAFLANLIFPVTTVLIIFLPTEKWFPGTAILLEGASWVDRHAGGLAIAGIFIGIAALPFAIFGPIPWRKKADQAKPETVAHSSDKGAD